MSHVRLAHRELALLTILAALAIAGTIFFSTTEPSMSVSPKLLAQITEKPSLQVATVAAGCFWGTEHIYRKHFLNKGVLATAVGYTGGVTSTPSYKEVCSGRTNHAEGLQILFDPATVSYETLIEFFFKMHDPTTVNRQGPDRGTQYRSAIFTHSPEQLTAAKAVRDQMQKTFWKSPIVTDIEAIGQWWDAEEYHQRYLQRNPGGYECPTHYLRTSPQL